MADDLVKRLRDIQGQAGLFASAAADRIEQLERERVLDAKLLADTQALLDKAVVAMRKAADGLDGYVGHGYGDYLRDVLAEIEGGKKDE